MPDHCENHMNLQQKIADLEIENQHLKTENKNLKIENKNLKNKNNDQADILDFNNFSFTKMKDHIDVLKQKLLNKSMTPEDLPWIEYHGHIFKPYNQLEKLVCNGCKQVQDFFCIFAQPVRNIGYRCSCELGCHVDENCIKDIKNYCKISKKWNRSLKILDNQVPHACQGRYSMNRLNLQKMAKNSRVFCGFSRFWVI